MTHYGMVNNNASEATTVLTVQGPDGNSEDIIFVIDTGDTGDLSLPHEIIERLGLPMIHEEEPAMAILADGTTRPLNLFYANVLWHGQWREVEVANFGPDPLIGMGLLQGSNLNVDAIPGGRVTITELSDTFC